MTKRDIIETIYEYDKEGNLLKKTVTETHEKEGTAYSYTTTSKPYKEMLTNYCDADTATCTCKSNVHTEIFA